LSEQEEERTYIAREIHDEAGQALTALSWGLAGVEESLPAQADDVRPRLAEMRQLAEQVMSSLRQLMSRLRPAVLDELGLAAALITYADETSSRYPFTVDVEITGNRRRLSTEIETTLYRIAQEAITNVARHAYATQARIDLGFGEEEITLEISDNGVGMDIDRGQDTAALGRGWGLAGIDERIQLVHGEFDIQSSKGSGTTLIVRIPYQPFSIQTEGEEI
jgi:signal transduction histidine kinase